MIRTDRSPYLLALFGTLALACAGVPKPRVAALAPASAVDAADDTVATSQPDHYTYSPLGKRDPFRPPGSVADASTVPRTGHGLTRFDVGDLRLTFANRSPFDSLAVVTDPSGREYMVAIGDVIGNKWGRIISIGHDEIVIREESESVGPNSAIVPELRTLRIAETRPATADENEWKWSYSSPG